MIEKARRALAALAVKLTPHLLDGEPQMRDQCFGVRCFRTSPRKLGIAREQQTLQRLDIIGQRIIGAHRQRWNHKMLLL